MNIYRALCIADGVTPSKRTPSDVTEMQEKTRNAQVAIALFTRYLGRVAGDLADFYGPWRDDLAGGISQIILPDLQKGAFREEFNDKAPHSAFQKSYLFCCESPARGLGWPCSHARTPQRFGVTIDGRRWRKENA